MMLLSCFLVATIFVSRSVALPGGTRSGHGGGGGSGGSGGHESSGGGSEVGRSFSGFRTGAVLSGRSGYSLGSAPELNLRSLNYSGDFTSGEGAPSAGDGSAGNNNTQSPRTSTALYTIANVTIHQYPLITNSLNDSNLPPINEDVILWIFDIDNGKPNATTAAQCNLTWTANTASSSNPPVRHHMRCVSKGVDIGNQGLPDHSPKYDVEFQQQTESPLSGFDLFVTSSTRGPAVWAPRSLSNDAAWQINENYFHYPAFVPIGKAPLSKKRAATLVPDVLFDHIKAADITNDAAARIAVNSGRSTSDAPIDLIEDTDPSNETTISAAANDRRSAPDDSSVQSIVAGIVNSTLAQAAVHASSATFNVPDDQIEISEIINSTLAHSALNIDSAMGNSPSPALDTSTNQNEATSPANNTVINAAIAAASKLFNIPTKHIKFVNNTNNTTAGAATSGSGHIQTADIILNTTVSAAANAASTLFNIP